MFVTYASWVPNAIDGRDVPNLGLAWLAGLLEAEGTFLKPIPSDPGLPVIACQMTDLDVVKRVGNAFGTTVATLPRNGRYRSVHVARARGSRAVALMRDLVPMLSARRAIRKALKGYSSPPDRKLDFLAAEEIRERARPRGNNQLVGAGVWRVPPNSQAGS